MGSVWYWFYRSFTDRVITTISPVSMLGIPKLEVQSFHLRNLDTLPTSTFLE